MAKSKKRDVPTEAAPGLTHKAFGALASLQVDDAGPASEPNDEPPEVAVRYEPKLVVRRETKGRAGKTVTRITGVRSVERDAVVAKMKRALGCGAVIEGEDVVLLGSLVDRAAEWLEADGARRVVRSG